MSWLEERRTVLVNSDPRSVRDCIGGRAYPGTALEGCVFRATILNQQTIIRFVDARKAGAGRLGMQASCGGYKGASTWLVGG